MKAIRPENRREKKRHESPGRCNGINKRNREAIYMHLVCSGEVLTLLSLLMLNVPFN